MSKERLYRVVFDTQKDRQYTTWGLFVLAHSQREAKEIAFNLWDSNENKHLATRKCDKWLGIEWLEHPHMFHTNAARMTDEERNGRELGEFFVIYSKYANWGRR